MIKCDSKGSRLRVDGRAGKSWRKPGKAGESRRIRSVTRHKRQEIQGVRNSGCHQGLVPINDKRLLYMSFNIKNRCRDNEDKPRLPPEVSRYYPDRLFDRLRYLTIIFVVGDVTDVSFSFAGQLADAIPPMTTFVLLLVFTSFEAGPFWEQSGAFDSFIINAQGVSVIC